MLRQVEVPSGGLLPTGLWSLSISRAMAQIVQPMVAGRVVARAVEVPVSARCRLAVRLREKVARALDLSGDVQWGAARVR